MAELNAVLFMEIHSHINICNMCKFNSNKEGGSEADQHEEERARRAMLQAEAAERSLKIPFLMLP